MPALETWSRRLLALLFGSVFVYAAVMKLQDPTRFQLDIKSFEMLRDPFSAWLAISLPWMELFAGLAVITGLLRQGGALLLNLALVMFFIALGYAWHRGLNIECGCFGGSSKAPDYPWLFLRDGLLLALGLAVMWLERRRLSLISHRS